MFAQPCSAVAGFWPGSSTVWALRPILTEPCMHVPACFRSGCLWKAPTERERVNRGGGLAPCLEQLYKAQETGVGVVGCSEASFGPGTPVPPPPPLSPIHNLQPCHCPLSIPSLSSSSLPTAFSSSSPSRGSPGAMCVTELGSSLSRAPSASLITLVRPKSASCGGGTQQHVFQG